MKTILSSPTTPKRPKPYDKFTTPGSGANSEDESKPPTKRSSPVKSRGTPSPKGSKAQSKPWTGDEYRTMFQYVVKHGAPGSEKGWEGVVPGRSGAQTRSAWRNTVLPHFDRFLATQGKDE